MGEKGNRTKTKIQKEAYTLFADKGYKEVTMKDICEAAGLSRGGLYRHYSNTGEILADILCTEYVIDDKMEQEMSAVDILEMTLKDLRIEMLDSASSLSLAIYEYAAAGNQQVFIEANAKAVKRWNKLIEYGMKRNEFNKVSPMQITDMILYSYQGVRMWSRVIEMPEETVDNLLDLIRQLLIKER